MQKKGDYLTGNVNFQLNYFVRNTVSHKTVLVKTYVLTRIVIKKTYVFLIISQYPTHFSLSMPTRNDTIYWRIYSKNIYLNIFR